MHAISGFSKLSKTIRQTSSNIPRQTHTPMAKASPIPSKSNARVQSQKLIESSNQTSSNILKQQSSRARARIRNTNSVSFSIRLDIIEQLVSHSRFYQPH